MQLFELKNYQVIFAPQTMMIEEFAKIRDKNNDNDLTLKEISYVWFFADVASDFQNIMDPHARGLNIAESINLPPKWKPSKEVRDAIAYYQKYSKTASSGLYKACMISAEFIEERLKKPKTLLSETDSRGNPVYKIDSILKMMKDIPDVMQKLHDAREQVIKEVESKTELKGNKAKAMFEDGI